MKDFFFLMKQTFGKACLSFLSVCVLVVVVFCVLVVVVVLVCLFFVVLCVCACVRTYVRACVCVFIYLVFVDFCCFRLLSCFVSDSMFCLSETVWTLLQVICKLLSFLRLCLYPGRRRRFALHPPTAWVG